MASAHEQDLHTKVNSIQVRYPRVPLLVFVRIFCVLRLVTLKRHHLLQVNRAQGSYVLENHGFTKIKFQALKIPEYEKVVFMIFFQGKRRIFFARGTHI
jgi:hypothetical protein